VPQTETRHTHNRTKPEPHKSIPQKSHKRIKHHDRNPPNQRNRLDSNHSLLRKILRTLRPTHENRHQIRNPRMHHQHGTTPLQPRNHTPKHSQRNHRSKTTTNRHTILRNNTAKPKRNQKKRRKSQKIRPRNRTGNREHNAHANKHHPNPTKRSTQRNKKMKPVYSRLG
jgi:hypothetical protein